MLAGGAVLVTRFGGVVSAALLVAGLLRFRSDRIKQYLLHSDPLAADEQLPNDCLGIPRRADFWIVLLIAETVFAILLYAGTRSSHG